MAKASAAHSSPMSAVPPHFILDESTQFKLHRVGIALAGIGTLTAGQDQEQEDDQIEIPRSELSAIFDLVSDHLVALLNNLPYTRTRSGRDNEALTVPGLRNGPLLMAV